MTAFSDILMNNFLQNVDDLRITNDLASNPAGAMRRLAVGFENAIPMFDRPPEITPYLAYTAPLYSSYTYTSDASDAAVEVSTGQIGYELCSCGLVTTDAYGNPSYTPVNAAYDSATGVVILPAPVAAGEYEMDFYTDGQFTNTLTSREKRILGLCMQVAWEGRFGGDWLSRTPTIQDKTFKKASSESAWTSAQMQKLRQVYDMLYAEMNKYEQNRAYNESVHASAQS